MPDRFVGTWYGHSRKLVIGPDGSIHLSFRLYVPCTADRTTGCDLVAGNRIEDGGRVTAHVTGVSNPTTITADVTRTSTPETSPRGPVRIGYNLTEHAVAIFGGGFGGEPFCGKQSPPGYCGA